MSLHLQSPPDVSNGGASSELHPVVYRAAAALVIWYVAAAWLLFGGPGYIDLALVMISTLVFVMISILNALWRTSAKARRARAGSAVSDESEAAGETEPFASWLRHEFSTWTDRQKGTTAAVEILLPIAAVAFGLTALGIVLDLVRANVI